MFTNTSRQVDGMGNTAQGKAEPDPMNASLQERSFQGDQKSKAGETDQPNGEKRQATPSAPVKNA
jgi:hypothetical protein